MEEKLTIQEIIRSAREESLDEFKHRFKQKWLLGMPVFQRSEIQMSEELKSVTYTENPTIWVMRDLEEIEFSDKIWSESDVVKVISFDHIENAEIYPTDEAFDLWLQEDINCGLGMLNTEDTENSIMCYTAGSGNLAKHWNAAFLRRIKNDL
ncbi:MAG: hypothetical protein COA32_13910 [Fluviicola sp.]|nr:MAG: hypothetical protein COA32_13910 [Fluviicola sp.]